MADKHTEECKKHKAIFGGVGCTCHGTGEKKLDRPDREKIAKVIYADWGFGKWDKLMPAEKRAWLKTADQIKALFPDVEELKEELRVGNRLTATLTDKCRALELQIEEAKREERESMSNVFGYIEDMFPELRSSYWNTKRWVDFKNEQLGQALKGQA